MLLVPWVIPPAMSTLAWQWLFDPSYSAFNYTWPSSALADPVDRRCRLGALLGHPGQYLGRRALFMIMYLAALKSVPDQLYEAAAIDGANWWQRIWYVTLRLMRNIIAITTLFSR